KLLLRDLEGATERQATLPAPEPGVVAMGDGLLTFSPDARLLAFSYSAATRPSDLYVWDLQADSIVPLTHSSEGGLPSDSFAAPELVYYPTFDSVDGKPRQIPAWFYRATNNGKTGNSGDGPAPAPVPVVVIVHGGPEGQYRPNFQFLAQYLVNNGYAVLAPNVRGSSGYGKAYGHLDDVRKRMDSVADLAQAAYWLKQQPGIDGERIAVYGGSYGGFMVLAALTNYPDLWAAGVDIVGVSNFATFLENTSEYRRAHREAEYGSLANDRDFLEEIAPLNHADKIVAPVIVLHGANDPRVPVSEARQLVAALEARHVPVEFIVFDDEGHGVVKLKNKLVAYPAIVQFLDKHLKAGK
ncbi:MAG: S9 family peptidase, partial [Chloroflexota bacterium]|nr:S9 family peptidase [Chloroflexota bacterium]